MTLSISAQRKRLFALYQAEARGISAENCVRDRRETALDPGIADQLIRDSHASLGRMRPVAAPPSAKPELTPDQQIFTAFARP